MATVSKAFETNGDSKEIIFGKKIAELKKRLLLSGMLSRNKTVTAQPKLSFEPFLTRSNFFFFHFHLIVRIQRVEKRRHLKNGKERKRKIWIRLQI